MIDEKIKPMLIGFFHLIKALARFSLSSISQTFIDKMPKGFFINQQISR